MHACTLLFLDLSEIQDSLDQLASIYLFSFPVGPFITIIYLFIYLFFSFTGPLRISLLQILCPI